MDYDAEMATGEVQVEASTTPVSAPVAPAPKLRPHWSMNIIGIAGILALCYFGESVLAVMMVSVLLAFILAPVVDLLPERAHPYFRAQWITLGQDAVISEPSFAVLVVLTGSVAVSTHSGGTLKLSGGDKALVPYGAGFTKLEGSGEVIRCLPPASDAGVGEW